MKIRPVKADLFHTVWRTDTQQTDITKLIVGFSQFCERA